MRYATLRQIVAEATSHAHTVESSPEARQAVYGMALGALRLALDDDAQTEGWARVARTLTTRDRLPVDALNSSPADQARRRLALLSELPDVHGFTSFQDVVDLIGQTISKGAPLYNGGDPRSCAALYWMVIRLICETTATRGFPGYARVQSQLKPLADAEASPERMSHDDADAWAWELRHALDATVRVATA